MKKIYKPLLTFLLLSSAILINGCDPFEDFYIVLPMDTEMNSSGLGNSINISSDLCLNDFSDYTDNQDNLEEIKYVSTAYTTINATPGLQGDNARIRIYQSDGTTLLSEFSIPTFVAADYVEHPLEIKFTQQQVDNINRYLANHQVNNCFKADLQISNVQYQGVTYSLNAKFEILAQLKVKP